MRARFPFVFPVLALVLLVAGCPSKESVGAGAISVLGPGVINNPHNKSLRFDILKFGLGRFCFEMTRRGAPLKLNDDQPVLGRFFARSCSSQVLENTARQSLVVQYSGTGYGWTNLSGRIGFSAAGLIEYAPDFQMSDNGAMYIYFRPRKVNATSFKTLMVESVLARGGMAVAGLDPDRLGRQIVQSQLQRGFTVIRENEKGETDFGLGIIPKGQKPFKPFSIKNADKVTLANDRTEVHGGQQDYVGGFEVPDSGKALYITMTLDGAPAVDVFVVPKGVGDAMIDRYVKKGGASPLTARPLLDEPLVRGQVWKRYLALPKGMYYLVIDHSSAAGRTAPPAIQGGEQAAKVDYLVELGDAP